MIGADAFAGFVDSSRSGDLKRRLVLASLLAWMVMFAIHAAGGVAMVAARGSAEPSATVDLITTSLVLAMMVFGFMRVQRAGSEIATPLVVAWVVGPPMVDYLLLRPIVTLGMAVLV